MARDRSFNAQVVRTESPEWAATLAVSTHDVYHLPGYVAISARHDGGSAAALLVSDGERRLLLPLVVREIPGGWRDATSPYGYPGPLVIGPVRPGFASDAMAAGIRELVAHGFVSLFVRLHPLLPVRGFEDCGVVVEHGDTVVIDLSLDTEQLWRQTSRNHRQDIERATREGLSFEIGNRTPDIEDFKRLYRLTMARRNAAGYYRFDDQYFDALCEALGPRMHLAVVRLGSRAAAAAIVTTSCRIVQIHLAGWDQNLAHLRPMKVLVHGVRSWAKEEAQRWLHLGGGLGARSDGLLRFKKGFSPCAVPFRTVRIILDDPAYRHLALSHDPTADLGDPFGFFPAYRKEAPGTTA